MSRAAAVEHEMAETILHVHPAKVRPSETNPRRTVRDKGFDQLVDSVRTHGVLQPILVRPTDGKDTFELVAGHRRLAAATEAALPVMPAFVRMLSDKEALEIQVIENIQRSDLHALEEAQGYAALMRHGYDVARIAERIGMSAKYVYDRVKLLQLIPDVQNLFLKDRITAGHAIILARLKPKDQERAIDVSGHGSDFGGTRSPLFIEEHTLFDPEEEVLSKKRKEDPLEGYKTRSVRELQAWVDEHVRFDHGAPDVVDLFPDTRVAVLSAESRREKIIPITRDWTVPEDAREDGTRTYGAQAWRRADGKAERSAYSHKQTKGATCEHSVTGVIVVGPGRGQAFKVCIAKEKCSTHWADWQKERAAQRRSAAAGAGKKGEAAKKREAAQEASRKEEEKRRAELVKRYNQAESKILATAAATILKAQLTHVIAIVEGELEEGIGWQSPKEVKSAADLVRRGTTADSILRHLAMRCLVGRLVGVHNHWQLDEVESALKPLKLDLKKLLDEHAPVQTSAEPATRAKAAKKK